MGISCNQNQLFDGQGTITVALGSQGRTALDGDYSGTWPADVNLVFEKVALTVFDGERIAAEKEFTDQGPYTLGVPPGANYRLRFEGKINRDETRPKTFAQSYSGQSEVFSVEPGVSTNVPVQLVAQDRDIIFIQQNNSDNFLFTGRSSPDFESLGNSVYLGIGPDNLPFRFDLDGPGRALYKTDENQIQVIYNPETRKIIHDQLYGDETNPDAIAWNPREKALYSLCFNKGTDKLHKNDFTSNADTAQSILLPNLTIPSPPSNSDTAGAGASAALDIDIDGSLYLTAVSDGKLTIVKGSVSGAAFVQDQNFSLKTQFENTRQITDIKVIRGKLYILVLYNSEEGPAGGEFIIADARTGRILAEDVGASSNSSVHAFYNPGFFAGWSGDKLYVYDYAPNISVGKVRTQALTWSGRIVEINISDPYKPVMTNAKVLGFSEEM
jgi:hypothetical protein